MSNVTQIRPKYRSIRQSTLGDMDICQRRAQYNVAGFMPRTSSEAAVIGTGYHAGLEAYYLDRIVDPAIDRPSGEMIQCYIEAAHVGLDEELRKLTGFEWDTTEAEARALMTRMVATYFEGCPGDQGGYQWPNTFTVLAVEHTFEHEFQPGWTASGTVDLVLQRQTDGFLILDDHKTSGKMWSERKADPRENNQAAWYALWVQEDFPDHPGLESWFSVMRRDSGKFRRFKSEIRQAHLDAVVDKATSVAGLLDSGFDLPPNQTSNLCSAKYCDAWTLCPWGSALAQAA